MIAQLQPINIIACVYAFPSVDSLLSPVKSIGTTTIDPFRRELIGDEDTILWLPPCLIALCL